MTDGGVKRWMTKLMGTIRSRLVACTAVRGKPSRMNDADGAMEVGCGFDEDEGDCVVLDGVSQPLVANSEEMRSSMTASGTRFPACMSASA